MFIFSCYIECLMPCNLWQIFFSIKHALMLAANSVCYRQLVGLSPSINIFFFYTISLTRHLNKYLLFLAWLQPELQQHFPCNCHGLVTSQARAVIFLVKQFMFIYVVGGWIFNVQGLLQNSIHPECFHCFSSHFLKLKENNVVMRKIRK